MAADLLDGGEFGSCAAADPSLWTALLGATLEHHRFGAGRVESVEEADGAEPIVHVHFANHGIKIFPAGVFNLGPFHSMKVAPEFQHRVSGLLEEVLRQRRVQEDAFAEVQALAERYHVRVTKQMAGELQPVLEKVEARSVLSDEEVSWLQRHALFNVLAAYYFRMYRAHSDPWLLVKACASLRRAGLPQRAIAISEQLASQPSPNTGRVWGALLTTRGGALRDTGALDDAMNAAVSAATAAPDSFHPHNLMGAICYERGDYSEGDDHFAQAVELGSSGSIREYEIKSILERAPLDERDRILAHLSGRRAGQGAGSAI